MNPNITAQANQAAAQGQQLLTNYQAKAGEYKNQYSTYQGQADQANSNIQKQTTYMQGEGSAGNQYHNELGSQLGQLGYDPAQMTAARNNLNQATGAQSAYSDYANQAASKWGLNAGGFAAANAGALAGINNNIASNQGIVNGLQSLYSTAQTGANQFAGVQVQGQHETLSGLQNVFTNAASQRDSASSMMNFYDQLAQQQGGLNSKQAADYAAVQQALASANQALAQASLLASQTTGQNLTNTQTQAAMDAAKKKGMNLTSNGKTTFDPNAVKNSQGGIQDVQ